MITKSLACDVYVMTDVSEANPTMAQSNLLGNFSFLSLPWSFHPPSCLFLNLGLWVLSHLLLNAMSQTEEGRSNKEQENKRSQERKQSCIIANQTGPPSPSTSIHWKRN